VEKQTGPTTWMVVGADLPTYNTGPLSATTNYRVWVNADESGCEDVYSSVVSVIVSPDIVITTQPSNVNECVGGTNTISVTITGGSGTITYQWQQSADGSTVGLTHRNRCNNCNLYTFQCSNRNNLLQGFGQCFQ
jgi:hypothetical protein